MRAKRLTHHHNCQLTLCHCDSPSTGWEATIKERIAWLDQLTSAETAKAMPHYVGSASRPAILDETV